MFAQGKDHTLNNKDSIESFEVGNMHFNSLTSKYSSLKQTVGNLPETTNSMIIKSSFDQSVAQLSIDNITLLGKAAVQAEQANCSSDGNYCNVE